MNSIISILVAILIFGLIVLVHEFGHFFFARRNGITVEEFAIGMGPKIVGKKLGDTLFSIRALPFGGFCRLLGEDELVEDVNAYSSKSVWAKIQVVIGGPLFNMLLAFVFAIVFLLISGRVLTPVISEVSEGSPAQAAGLQIGDKLVAINDKNIVAYNEVQIYINENKGQAIELTYKRNGEKIDTVITPKLDKDNLYRIGVSPTAVSMSNPLNVVKYALIEIVFWVKMVFYGFGMLFSGAISANEVAGPVGIVTVVSEGYKSSIEMGLLSVIQTISFFIILLSANLGIMNLLPIPALDGGRLVFLIIEAIRRKPMNEEKEGKIHFIGYVLLMLLMVVVLFNDVRKLF
ncbi:MAG: RIP metalloprotease RseP [Firmicutes bacterium HGW-Firmicutes-1]|jgi:regulator of sigma E protease|nr:MAG: RIP metalloprotease RseP [Firmicutes bacterium HGW-Firmicutes-1]